MGGSRWGGVRDVRPPLGPNSFIFMQFWGIFSPNNRLAPPPWELAPPPLGNHGSATAWCKLLDISQHCLNGEWFLYIFRFFLLTEFRLKSLPLQMVQVFLQFSTIYSLLVMHSPAFFFSVQFSPISSHGTKTR